MMKHGRLIGYPLDMSKKSLYLERYAYKGISFEGVEIPKDTEIIVCLPAYKEPNLCDAIDAILDTNPIQGHICILVLVNESEKVSKEIQAINVQAYQACMKVATKRGFSLFVEYQSLPAKKAGVGLARKILMDKAVFLFDQLNKDGIITCFDADCTCDSHLFEEIQKTFHGKLNTLITYFEHPLDHDEIVQYELFLRYHIDSQRYAGFPFAFQTLGSCISVRCSAYMKQGGMNTRQAGEDFYFLHKMAQIGELKELNTASIYPSARASDRVPFGTGLAVAKIRSSLEYLVYSPRSYEDLKMLFTQVEMLYEGKDISQTQCLKEFHETHHFDVGLSKAIKNATSFESFRKHFFRWWDAFRILKFLHFARDKYYPEIPLGQAIQTLDNQYWRLGLGSDDLRSTLHQVRAFDRNVDFQIK